MNALTRAAAEYRTAVLCVIHQPPSRVFATFDDALVLAAGGHAAYVGVTGGMAPALAAAAAAVSGGAALPPENASPAEFVLNLVNPHFTDAAEVGAVLVAARKLQQAAPPLACGADRRLASPPPPLPPASWRRAGPAAQVAILLGRHASLTRRDPALYAGRFVAFLVACSFFALIIIEARARVQEQVFNRLLLLMWMSSCTGALGVVAVFALHEDFRAIRRECRDGMLMRHGRGRFILLLLSKVSGFWLCCCGRRASAAPRAPSGQATLLTSTGAHQERRLSLWD